ncbi:hypothetical protein IE81DRAFT_15429 [Ceraceosorus guamensis]|uniref:Uncharacterized protein n=1 Tax=Ceraceosorus guamensis TaxID=1522189 RepID=A0A316VRD4_9BASI|nr:hypothetical protein IE81DRAFT_15429 [Ceraceosorus guamensis]PWN39608.1 hypothetical protein IE81DRAFT_15429 [Ceraceosorus guamensis]
MSDMLHVSARRRVHPCRVRVGGACRPACLTPELTNGQDTGAAPSKLQLDACGPCMRRAWQRSTLQQIFSRERMSLSSGSAGRSAASRQATRAIAAERYDHVPMRLPRIARFADQSKVNALRPMEPMFLPWCKPQGCAGADIGLGLTADPRASSCTAAICPLQRCPPSTLDHHHLPQARQP